MRVDSHHQQLKARTKTGNLFCRVGESVQCTACAHQCRIGESKSGICGVRWNDRGDLRVPYGYVSSLACDPIEKKPFYHFFPGEQALSFGMLGCNFHCEFCQNWRISQTCRDAAATSTVQEISEEDMMRALDRSGAGILASTYNEPLITIEWAVSLFRGAKAKGIRTCYISNGFASADAVDYLEPWLDAINIDLKCFTEEGYRRLGGQLEPVKEAVETFWKRGKWVEVITLIVPGFNDSGEELTALTEFIAGVSPDIPWHVSAYHPDYKMASGHSRTSPEAIEDAMRRGRDAGLNYIYAGNIWISGASDTRCHGCGAVLVERTGFGVRRCLIGSDGRCPSCGSTVPGIWGREPGLPQIAQ